MKNTITFLLFSLVYLPAFSQYSYSIKGKIIDKASQLPLQGASVFAENTTIGTATDNEGVFHLRLPNGGYNLVITFTGYQTETKRITTADAGGNDIVIEINKIEKSMSEFVVKASYEVKNGWEKYGDFFLENFIGKTANSQECSIKNRDAIKFFFYRRKNLLKILSEEPVEIVNNALGYVVKYTLDSFTHDYNSQVSQYTGYPLFQEMTPENEEQKNKWIANRLVAYNGSILHFMRSMYRKKLKDEGFEIQFLLKDNKGKETAMPLKDFYGAMNYDIDDSSKTVDILPNQKDVAVIYKNEEPSALYLTANPDASSKFQLSVLSFSPKESIDIERNGYYYEQNDITFTGYWAWEKVADMLPYNFKENFEESAVTKEIITPVIEPVKPINEPVVTIATTGDQLTLATWQMDESRVIDGNSMFYYKREGQENTINFDNDSYKFNADNTGIYFYNGQEYKFNWKYLNAEKTKMEIVILYPTPLIVNLENIMLTASSFKYTRLQKVNGVNLVAIETRTAK
jgi:hypothetical protein